MQYFKYEEFDSPDQPGSGSDNMCPDFLELLDFARGQAGIEFRITSGYRSREHNAKVGGKPESSHLVGKAADIACKNSRDRFIIVSALLDAGFTRIGIADTFIHVDSDSKSTGGDKSGKVIWTY
mgnify:FL=1